jgi:hypothetical protein
MFLRSLRAPLERFEVRDGSLALPLTAALRAVCNGAVPCQFVAETVWPAGQLARMVEA